MFYWRCKLFIFVLWTDSAFFIWRQETSDQYHISTDQSHSSRLWLRKQSDWSYWLTPISFLLQQDELEDKRSFCWPCLQTLLLSQSQFEVFEVLGVRWLNHDPRHVAPCQQRRIAIRPIADVFRECMLYTPNRSRPMNIACLYQIPDVPLEYGSFVL